MNEKRQATPHPHRAASRILLALDVIGLVLLLYSITSIAAKFRQIFNDILEDQKLPALTQSVLSLPRTGATVIVAGAIAALIYKEVRIANNARNVMINATAFGAIVIAFVLFVVAVFTPLSGVITRISD